MAKKELVECARSCWRWFTILAGAAAGELPDVIQSGYGLTPVLSRRGLLVPLDDFLAREGAQFLADYFPGAMAPYVIDGRVYSIPIFLQLEGLFSNPEILLTAGVAPPEPGWTWDDLLEKARRTRRLGADGSIEQWGLVANTTLQLDYTWMGQADMRFINEALELTVNSPALHETYNWILNAVDTDVLRYRGIHADAPANNEQRGLAVAFMADGNYRQPTWDALESPYVTAPPIRRNAASAPATLNTSRAWAILNVAPEKQAAAWEVIKFLQRPENLSRFAAAMSYLPATASAANSDLFQEFVRTQRNMQVWVSEYLPIRTVELWPWSMGLAPRTPLLTLSNQLVGGQITLAEFIETAEQNLRRVIEEYRGGY